MIEGLHAYFRRQLPSADLGPLLSAFSPLQQLSRGAFLVQPGQQCDFLAYIHSGAFRVFFLNEKGQELTTWFSFADMFVTDLLAYYKEAQATYFVEAVEKSEVSLIRKPQLESLYGQYPAYQEFGRKFAERGMTLVMDRMVSLQTKSAEERYLELLEQPKFLQKIPLKYLATYLGITDSSLSRIRKQLG